MTRSQLKDIGALIYACEGTKLRKDKRYANTYFYSIEFTNSDPKLVCLFLKFMQEVLAIDIASIKGQLFTYPDLDERVVMETWSKKTGLQLAQFQKNIMLRAKTGKFKSSPLGTFKIRYTNKGKFLELQKYIDDIWVRAGIATS